MVRAANTPSLLLFQRIRVQASAKKGANKSETSAMPNASARRVMDMKADRMRRVGVLMNLAADDPEGQARLTAFCGAAGIGLDRRPQFAHRLPLGRGRHRTTAIRGGIGRARAGCDLGLWPADCGSVATGYPYRADRVRGVVDPVGAGFVESLARPGGNTTGFTAFEYGMSGKWLELLKEIAPSVTRAAVLRDPTIAAGIGQFAAIQAVAPSSEWR